MSASTSAAGLPRNPLSNLPIFNRLIVSRIASSSAGAERYPMSFHNSTPVPPLPIASIAQIWIPDSG